MTWRGVSEGMAAAIAAVRNGKLTTAEVILVDLVAFAPAETRAWKLLARVQRELGHFDAGLISARRALHLQSMQQQQEPPASLTLARLFFEQGEHNEAKAMLARLIDRNPHNQELLQLRDKWQTETTA